MELLENCQLEWNKERGVLYIHNKENGMTVLRMCGLKQRDTGSLNEGMIDITRPERVSYPLSI